MFLLKKEMWKMQNEELTLKILHYSADICSFRVYLGTLKIPSFWRQAVAYVVNNAWKWCELIW
jgi:hypothetical protein